MANKKSWFVRHKYGIIFSKTLDKLYIKKYNKDVETQGFDVFYCGISHFMLYIFEGKPFILIVGDGNCNPS